MLRVLSASSIRVGGLLGLVLLLAACGAHDGDHAAHAADDGHGHADVGAWPTAADFAAAVNNPERPEQERARDATRKPAEVLAFFGIRPGMHVADMMGGTGYYTQLLSSAVGPDGTVYIQNNKFVVERFVDGPLTELLKNAGLRNVVRLDREVEDPGLPEGLDAAIMVRFYHDLYWQGADRAAFNSAVFESLKPGGIFGIVDHHAEAGSRDRDVQTLHRVDAAMVREEIEAAGFVLDAESDLLADPQDTLDWNIFDDDAARRDKTSRFIYRFKKPESEGGGQAQHG